MLHMQLTLIPQSSSLYPATKAYRLTNHPLHPTSLPPFLTHSQSCILRERAQSATTCMKMEAMMLCADTHSPDSAICLCQTTSSFLLSIDQTRSHTEHTHTIGGHPTQTYVHRKTGRLTYMHKLCHTPNSQWKVLCMQFVTQLPVCGVPLFCGDIYCF